MSGEAFAWWCRACDDYVEAVERPRCFGRYCPNGCDGSCDLVPDVRPLQARIAELEHERDAYKRAKEENDDRFMRERDEARERVAELEADNANLRVMVLAGGGVSETLARIAKLEADNARLTAELADVHALDEFSQRDKRLYAAHPVVKMNGYWSVVIGPGKDFTAATAPEARRAAIEWLRANQKEKK